MRFLYDTRLIFGRYLRQTLRSKVAIIFGAFQPLLYLLFFGPLLTRVAGVRGFGAANAWQVYVPGLLIQLALFSAGFVGFGLLADLRSGVVERLRVTPMSRTALLLGRVLRDTVVTGAQAVLLVATGIAFGLRAPAAGVALGLGLVMLLTAGIASLSYVLALRTRNEDAFAPLLTTVTVPLMLLSGVLLPMAMAPRWLELLSRGNPFRYLVDGARAAFLGDYTGHAAVTGAAVAVALTAISVLLGTRAFSREHT